jgi:polar amino acid transport system permease protein
MIYGFHWDLTSNWAFAQSILPMLLIGMEVTIEATVFGFLIAMTVGLVFALARAVPLKIVSWPTAVVVEFVRDTPLLIQLYFLFYVLPDFGLTLPALATGVITLGIQYSGYTSEVYRAGIDAVPAGQREAARALNLSAFRTYRDVIIPQAIPRIVPALANYLVSIMKDTPILSAITIMEMLGVGKIIGDRTFRYMIPLTMVGILFLILTVVTTTGVRFIERRVPRSGIGLK